MTSDEFRPGMNKLIEQFGKGAYSPARTALIFKAVRELPVHAFNYVVDQFIGSSRQAPLVDEFEEAVFRFRRNNEIGKLPEILDGCTKCANTPGFVFAQLNEDPIYTYVFKCPCPDGQKQVSAYPFWGEEYYGKFTPEDGS